MKKKRRKVENRGTKATILRQNAYELLENAKRLFNAGGTPEGVIELAGYAIELLLKALICYQRKLERLPKEYEHHDLKKLVDAANPFEKLAAQFPAEAQG